jgi:hypothetical protein
VECGTFSQITVSACCVACSLLNSVNLKDVNRKENTFPEMKICVD